MIRITPLRSLACLAVAGTLVASLAVGAGAQTTTTTAAKASGASSRSTGVTDTTIRLGVPRIDFEKLREVGTKIDRGDPQRIADALAAGINDRGGINGRKVEIDVVEFDILNPASAESSCVKLAEDLQVFAVVGAYNSIASSTNQCLVDHDLVVTAEDVDPKTLSQSSSATPVITAYPSANRTKALFAKLMAKKGAFRGKTVGIVSDATTAPDVKKVLVPALKKQGITPKVVLVSDGPPGDSTAETATWDVFAEKISAEGVDHVILVGGETAGGFTQILDRNLDVEVSSPDTDLVTTLGRTQTQHPPEAYDGALTVMAVPDSERFTTPEGQQCIADFQKANPGIKVIPPDQVQEGQTDWAVGVLSLCNPLTLFTKVAEKAGKDLTNGSYWTAATSMTQNFALPTGPYNTLGPKKFDAGNGLRLAVYDHAVGATGGLKPKGPLVDLGNG